MGFLFQLLSNSLQLNGVKKLFLRMENVVTNEPNKIHPKRNHQRQTPHHCRYCSTHRNSVRYSCRFLVAPASPVRNRYEKRFLTMYHIITHNNIVIYCGGKYRIRNGFVDGIQIPKTGINYRISNHPHEIGSEYKPHKSVSKEHEQPIELVDGNVKVFQIYYNAATKARIFPQAEPIDNSGKCTPFFENIPIRDILMNPPDCEFISILSWKFHNKTNKNYDFIQNVKKSDLTLLWNHSETWIVPIMIQTEQTYHQGIIELFQAYNRKLFSGKLDINKKLRTGFCNYWIAKTEFGKKYADEWLSPAIELALHDDEINHLINRPTHYHGHSKSTESELVRMYGKPHITYHPFFFERMVSIVFDHIGAKIKGI